MAKKELTREEQIAAEVARLQKMRGRSRQQQAELDWLLTLQARDRLQVEIDAGSRELTQLRAKYHEAAGSLAALEGQRAGLQDVPVGELLEAVQAKQANYAQCGALAAVVGELQRRIREAEAAQRARSHEFAQLTSQVMRLKSLSGIPG